MADAMQIVAAAAAPIAGLAGVWIGSHFRAQRDEHNWRRDKLLAAYEEFANGARSFLGRAASAWDQCQGGDETTLENSPPESEARSSGVPDFDTLAIRIQLLASDSVYLAARALQEVLDNEVVFALESTDPLCEGLGGALERAEKLYHEFISAAITDLGTRTDDETFE
ncbi:MAG: hypothetical protein ACRDZ1_13825 [Acidimicrobiia bacterium]|jgi:hypothetical protein